MGPCADVEKLGRYLLGESDLLEASEIEAHAEDCSRCQNELACLAQGDAGLDWHRLRDQCRDPESIPTSLRSLVTRVVRGPATVTTANGSATEAESGAVTFPGAPTPRGPLGQLDSYHIVEELGRGSFGIVYKAYDAELDCMVAIKVLRAELADDPRERARFVREARVACAMEHDHVVTIHRVGGAPGLPPYIVMEYIDGESLQERLAREGSLTPQTAA